jgi:hypothetical protein
LLFWKVRIIVSSYRRRGVTAVTSLSALLGIVFLAALVFGLLWATTGVRGARLPVLGSLTGLGMHVLLAFALLPLLVLHLVTRWSRVRARAVDFAGRRAVLRYSALSATGLVVWRASEAGSAFAGWDGARRRFTGSREIGSLQANAFPATNWFSDPKPRLNSEAWTLRIYGAVAQERVLTFDDLMALPSENIQATLDCTGGWFTRQVWTGTAVESLVNRAALAEDARSVVFHSATGYTRRYAIDDVPELLLATHVGNDPLSRGHGYPVRLVAPGRRGYDWVKWVVAIEVSELPGWFQSPLPLQ